jgi:hypothetical protein
MLTSKVCNKCNIRKDLNLFHQHKTTRDGYYHTCKECNNKISKETYHKNKIRSRILNRLHRFRLKQEIFNKYGGFICACCKETEPIFLTLDHMNNNGAEERRIHGNVEKLWSWLKRNNFPEGYQVLCFNCNAGKHLNNGICPHKRNI